MQGESADVEDSTKEAIDFIGASFRRNTQGNREESVARYESMIELDLSLRRPNTCENQSSGERPSLHPSSASAFTRYVHRPQCSVSPLITNQRKNVAASEDDNINRYNSSEPLPRQSSYPTTVPFNSIQFNTAAMTPASLSPSPSSVSPHEYSSMFHPFNGSMDAEERRHVSSATELSAIGNHCSANSSSVGKNQQSLQREAALNKFRMKRKDRCFEKKVRYESRKKLA
uniref:CCT domain-containing protein n=1 Tax=Brassica oleracea var. oleracea TaxID=109376 RepID=A0A0D2ZX67_BRAOL